MEKVYVEHRVRKFADIWDRKTPPPDEKNQFHVKTFNQKLLLRILDHVAGGVTRCTPERVSIPYKKTYAEVMKKLETWYLTARPADRKFLFFGHYRLANEAWISGSWRLNWCGICRKKRAFSSVEKWRQHYNRRHSILRAVMEDDDPVSVGLRKFHALGEERPLVSRFRKAAAGKRRSSQPRIDMDTGLRRPKNPKIPMKPTCVYWEKAPGC